MPVKFIMIAFHNGILVKPTANINQEFKNAITLRFICGYGGASAVPDQIKAAINLYVGHLYEHREAVTVGRISRVLELGLTRLLVPFALLEV